mmetsp:Transcript_86584/g.149843  ORF Transcript_86584/g.149843 Transcript_86584/m.149843 type:complete len:432 (+) Transcript_86584:54-1349(+)
MAELDAKLLSVDRPVNLSRADVPKRAWLLMFGIASASVICLAIAGVYSVTYPVLLGNAFLAFMLGLRHAVDGDHLAAIDNVTRQLVACGQRPISVGFWFAAGHSTVVVLMTGLIACGYSMAQQAATQGAGWADSLSLVAGIISIIVLAGIGLLNAWVARELYRDWSGLRRRSNSEQDRQVEDAAQSALRTALSSLPLANKLFRQVDQPGKMYLVGFIFGLSFDTATQVGLIGLASMAAATGKVPASIVMLIPMCFSCGMCFVDTGNGLLMLAAYTWANIRPMQKLFYNFLVTAMSATVALLIGSFETVQIVAQEFEFKGKVWDAIQDVDMGTIGYFIIGIFAAIFVTSICCGRAVGKTTAAAREDAQGVRTRSVSPRAHASVATYPAAVGHGKKTPRLFRYACCRWRPKETGRLQAVDFSTVHAAGVIGSS